MALTTIEPAQAFAPGCDLWIAPQAHNSALSGTLDWYLNGQLSKALSHVTREIEPMLNEIVKDNDLPKMSFSWAAHAPILVVAQNLLQTKAVLLVDFSKPAKEWTREVFLRAQGLGAKSIRVFAGSDFSFEEFHKSWNQIGNSIDLQMIRSEDKI